jgi:hypothetical protein
LPAIPASPMSSAPYAPGHPVSPAQIWQQQTNAQYYSPRAPTMSHAADASPPPPPPPPAAAPLDHTVQQQWFRERATGHTEDGIVQRRLVSAATVEHADSHASRHPRRGSATVRSLTLAERLPRVFREVLTPVMVMQIAVTFLLCYVFCIPIAYIFGHWGVPQSAPPVPTTVFCPSQRINANELVKHLLPEWQSTCQRCPSAATCNESGRMQCETGWMRVDDACVFLNELHVAGLAKRNQLMQSLEEHTGKVICANGDPFSPTLDSAWSSKHDLTMDQLRELVRPLPAPPGASQEELARFRKLNNEWHAVWHLAFQWTIKETVKVEEYERMKDSRGGAKPDIRVLSISPSTRGASRPGAETRYRAVYPRVEWGCDLRRTVWQHKMLLLLLTLFVFSTLWFFVFLWYYFAYLTKSSTLYDRLVSKLREDYYYDYDRRRVVHSPMEVAAVRRDVLKELGADATEIEKADREEMQVEKGATMERVLENMTDFSGRSQTSLFARLTFSRVESLMRADPDIEKCQHTFQFGAGASWRWIGPRPKSADQFIGSSGTNTEAGRAHNLLREAPYTHEL